MNDQYGKVCSVPVEQRIAEGILNRLQANNDVLEETVKRIHALKVRISGIMPPTKTQDPYPQGPNIPDSNFVDAIGVMFTKQISLLNEAHDILLELEKF